jgi:hypothetical protein
LDLITYILRPRANETIGGVEKMIIHRKKTILTAFITMALFLTACSGSNTPAVPEENPPSG